MTPSRRVRFDPSITASRAALAGDEVFGAWHSTDHVDVVDHWTGALLRTVTLEGYDTWVWGISVAGGMVHLIDDGRRDGDWMPVRIAAFDAVSGTFIREAVAPVGAALPGQPSGLWCESPRPELP